MQTDTLTVRMLTDNIDGEYNILLMRGDFKLFDNPISNMPEAFKDLEVDKFKYNHRLHRWEMQIITKN